MSKRMRWVFLMYRLPREPSTPRIAVWRKLRSLGVVQLLDGLAALPLSARNREHLEWLADEVVDAGGEAMVWIAEPTTAAQQRGLQGRMAEAIALEYREVAEAAREGSRADPEARTRILGRLRRNLHRIHQRDYFRPRERDETERALENLAEAAEARL